MLKIQVVQRSTAPIACRGGTTCSMMDEQTCRVPNISIPWGVLMWWRLEQLDISLVYSDCILEPLLKAAITSLGFFGRRKSRDQRVPGPEGSHQGQVRSIGSVRSVAEPKQHRLHATPSQSGGHWFVTSGNMEDVNGAAPIAAWWLGLFHGKSQSKKDDYTYIRIYIYI